MSKRHLLFLVSGVVALLVLSTTAFAQEVTPLAEQLFRYHRGQDIFFMFMLVAFLMLFIKRYEWGVCLMTMLIISVAFPFYFAVQTIYFGNAWNMDLIILGVVCAITLVISAGMFLGQVKTWQYIIIGLLFVIAYSINEWFLFTYLEGVADMGGSLLVHAFAAYFGYGMILSLRHKKIMDAPMKVTVHSVSFVWLASMLLWMLWPSFTTALLAPDQVIGGMLATYMALMASTVITYLVLLAIHKKIDPLVYTYAILAGGVAIGSTVDLVGPWAAFAIGLLAGIVSSLCFVYLHPTLEKVLGVRDVMGVHNLHGVPGILGALFAIPFAGAIQVTAAVGTFVIAIVTGLVAGLIMRAFGRNEEYILDDAESFSMEDARGTESVSIGESGISV
ncbi:MAG: ammonium transporter [Dethiobacter sp.]|jgi:ammonium transporter Rh|nr:MAG: ammonium transporter [Dethiobacter sp.]